MGSIGVGINQGTFDGSKKNKKFAMEIKKKAVAKYFMVLLLLLLLLLLMVLTRFSS